MSPAKEAENEEEKEADENDVPFQKRRGGILPTAGSIMKINS